MRFHRITIPAFGPFTDFSLDFPAQSEGGGDFHIIYGPNEAGKSSFLRAIYGFLFGIPGQSSDNFIHEYSALRILAEIEDSSGDIHIFQRRKGNRNTLLDEDGAAQSEMSLQNLFSQVDYDYFSSMFGLGSRELREGADELLRGDGRLGEALFSAQLGGTPVDKVMKTLEAESKAIFAGRTQGTLRKSLNAYKEFRTRAKDHFIKPEEWTAIEDGLSEKTALYAALQVDYKEVNRRLDTLKLCRSARPTILAWRDCGDQLESLRDLPSLPRDFSAKLEEAREHNRESRIRSKRIEGELQNLEKRSAELTLLPEVLAERSQIDALHTDLGAYRKDKSRLASLRTEAEIKQQEIQSTCRDLDITDDLTQIEALRTTRPKRLEAARIANALSEAKASLDSAQSQILKLERDRHDLLAKSSTANTDRLAELNGLLHQAAGIQPVAEGLLTLEINRRAAEQKLRDLQRQLPDAPEDLSAIPQLLVPSSANISDFRGKLESDTRRKEESIQAKEEIDDEILDIQRDIQRLSQSRDLPRIEDLKATRAHRDSLWDRVLHDWKGIGDTPAPPYEDTRPLEVGYRESVETADHIADQLRTEASDIAELVRLEGDLHTAQQKREAIETRILKNEEIATENLAAWHDLWKPCQLTPHSPSAMAEWRGHWREFCSQWEQFATLDQQLCQQREKVDHMAIALSKAIAPDTNSSDADFSQLLPQVKAERDRLEEAQQEENIRQNKLQSLETALQQERENLPIRQTEVDDILQQWTAICSSLTLPTDIAPTDAITLLQDREQLFTHYDTWQSQLTEQEGLRARIAEYEKKAETLRLSLHMDGANTEAVEAALWSALENAIHIQNNHDRFAEQIATATEELVKARSDQTLTKEQFDALFTQTGLDDEQELDPLLSRIKEYWTLSDHRDDRQKQIQALAPDYTFDEFLDLYHREDAENLPEEIANLEIELEELSTKRETASNERQEFERRRDELDSARAEAASNEQRAVSAAAALQEDAEQYARLEMALAILRSQIDNFRRENQGPFMEKASHWFSEITGKAFSGIATDYQDGDKPVIVGIRSTGVSERHVPIRGMSEGTRDQLYLALRFAGLEQHLQDHTPMPMILDDLLVHFDDGRSVHALRALARLAKQSQILLLTHHQHLLTLAEGNLSKGDFHVNYLRTSKA